MIRFKYIHFTFMPEYSLADEQSQASLLTRASSPSSAFPENYPVAL